MKSSGVPEGKKDAQEKQPDDEKNGSADQPSEVPEKADQQALEFHIDLRTQGRPVKSTAGPESKKEPEQGKPEEKKDAATDNDEGEKSKTPQKTEAQMLEFHIGLRTHGGGVKLSGGPDDKKPSEEGKPDQKKEGSAGKDKDEQPPAREKTTAPTLELHVDLRTQGEGVKSVDGQDEKKEGENGKGDDKKEASGDKDKDKDEKSKKTPLYKKPAFIITAVIVLILLIVGIIILWLIVRQYVSTDDAYIDGNITQVSPQISAQTIALHIDDNQFVHKGDLLVELDPTDYQVALDQAAAQVVAAEGQLAQAEARIDTAKASVTEAIAAVDAAQVQFDNANRDLKRYQDVDERARSKQQLDNSTTAQKNANAQLEQAKARKVSADADVVSAAAAVKAANGQLQTARASQKRAEVNLSYCKIFAPVDGRVTQRTLYVGNYVVPGQALFMLVDPNVWITANFKETQLTLMRPGQAVTISVDAFPDFKLRGHVDSIQAGSGARFGVLPAENATGNYVKIVQRVPVKIVFDHDANTNNAPMLSPGLSVEPRVTVR